MLVGRRLLEKVKEAALKANCIRLLVNIPNTRTKLLQWIERRNFRQVNTVSYPFKALHQEPNQKYVNKETEVQLVQFVNNLSHEILSDSDQSELYSGTRDGKKKGLILPPQYRAMPPIAPVADEVDEFGVD